MTSPTFTIEPDELLGLSALAALDRAAAGGGTGTDVVRTARGPSSDLSSEHESSFVVDTDRCTRFHRLVAVHDAPAVRKVAAAHVDPLRGAVI
jgi:hypothetical protein